MEKGSEERHNEISESQGSEIKIDKRREEQNTFVAQTLGINRNGKLLAEHEEGEKKKARMSTRKRSRSSEEKRGEKRLKSEGN